RDGDLRAIGEPEQSEGIGGGTVGGGVAADGADADDLRRGGPEQEGQAEGVVDPRVAVEVDRSGVGGAHADVLSVVDLAAGRAAVVGRRITDITKPARTRAAEAQNAAR